MSKQNIKIIFITTIITGIAMFGIFKNLFSQSDPQELTQAIKNGAMLVDVRTPAEFSAGSVDGAINIPLDKISSQIDSFKNKSNIIVFCRSGSRSGQAKSILEQNGISSVINGGTWQNVQQNLPQK